ncbi:MAG: Gloeo Verruco repeat-containing protein, partial [Verrucomicrobiaceae bacterium]|nr:Gloeo Verruco repeat-containing protein [Verrucomicrobiaceae bacterium]
NLVWAPINNAIPLDIALDTPGLNWTSDTPAAQWLGGSTVTHDGVDAAETLPVAANNKAVLATTINPATASVVSFWWKVSSEEYSDFLHFYNNGVETSAISAISGEQDWTKVTFVVPAGPRTLRWEYTKDYSLDEGQDKAWVDELTIVPVQMSTLVEALDSPSLIWTTSSGAEWTGSNAVTHDGVDAAASPPVADGGTSWIQTQVTGPGTLTFWWKASTIEYWNPLKLTINGNDTGYQTSGESDWTKVTITISAGTHTLRWSYTKSDQFDTTGEADGVWLDQVAFSATGGGTPEISVEQPVGTLLADGASTSFGSVATGGHGVRNFTIRNVGSSNLTGIGATLTGTNAGDFTLINLPASTVVPGGSTTVTVDFVPGAMGARTAALHIASNDADENPYDLPLTGSGVAPPDIVVEQPAGTGLVDGISSLNFGSLNTGAAATLTFTVKNKGTGVLSALAYSIDGVNLLDFAITHPATTSLAVNGSLTFTVKFSPVGAGSRQAALHILSNDPDEGSFDIGLIGTGVLAKPAISVPPVSLLVGTGESATFTVGAVGSGALTYKWLKNAKPIVGAVGSTYTIPVVALTDSGSFTASATSTLGTATSLAAVLGVVSRAPTVVTVNEATTLTLKVVTSIPAGVPVIYQWAKDGLPVSNVITTSQVVSGATTATLSVTKTVHANAGVYTCVVAMANKVRTSGNFSVDVRLKPVMDATAPLAWAVSGAVGNAFFAQNNPVSFTFKGLPAGVTGTTITSNGQIYGLLSGKPGLAVPTAKTFTITATNAAGTSVPVTYSYTVAALPANAIGTFNGLVDRDSTLSAPVLTPAGQKLQGHGGSLYNLAVTATGVFTATLKMEDKSYAMPAAARLDATVSDDPAATVIIPRGTGIASLTLRFSINRTNGHLTGTLTDGLVSTPVTVEGWKQVAPPAAMTGSYTAALKLDPALAGTGTTATNIAYPQGGGYLTVSLSAAGAATWGGKLADGTAITGSSSAGSAQDLPFHQFLYTPTVAATAGAAHGWLKITTDSVLTPVNSGAALLDGTVDWNRKRQPDTSTTRVYKTGFQLHNLTVEGGKYVAPLTNHIVLELPDVANNAKFTFSEGGLAGPPPVVGSVAASGLNKPFRITKTNTLVLPVPASNPAALTLKLTVSSGAFSGGFSLNNDPDPTKAGTFLKRPGTFDGILVPRLGQGVGWFLLPELPAAGMPNTTLTTSPELSGKVIIDAAP